MKVCPQCNSTDVPDKAKQCPFCLYRYEEPKKPDSIQQSAAKESAPENKNSNGQQTPVAASNANNPQSTGSGVAASNESAVINVPKKKRGKGKWIITFIVVCIIIMFIKSSSTDDDDYIDSSVRKDEQVEEVQEVVSTTVIEEEVEEEIPYEEEYILPHSNSVYLTEEDLAGLSKEELRIARNEIYARHGRRFKDSELQSYFDSKSWYEGNVLPEDFTDSYAESVFNEYELTNKDFIANYESKQ